MTQQIPTQVRADYVGYLRITMALHALEHIPNAAKRPPMADEAVRILTKWQEGLYKRCKDYLESPADAEDSED